MPNSPISPNGDSAAEGDATEPERLAALNSAIAQALVKGQILAETLAECCLAVTSHIASGPVCIWTANEGAHCFELTATAGPIGAPQQVQPDDTPVGSVLSRRQVIISTDLTADPRFEADWSRPAEADSFVGIPLIAATRLVGVLAVWSSGAISASATRALETTAQFIALGIERDLTQTRLLEQTDVVETVNRIGRMLSAELDTQKLVQAVTDAATELTGADFGSFFYNVIDDAGDSYMLYTLSGAPREAFSSFPMPRATELFGPTFRGQGTIRIADVKADPRYGKSEPYLGMPAGHLPVTSYLAVSVISRSGEVIGGLFFGHPDKGVFTERHERIVEGLAAQAAIAMDNARLYEKAQATVKESEEVLERANAARQQAEDASRAKDEFLGVLSHEMRTPLSAILGWSGMMASGELSESQSRDAVESVERNARLQLRMIEDMLDISRITLGKLRLDVKPVDLMPVINNALEILRPAADAKEIRVQVALDFGAGRVTGDSSRLQQVMWNLLSNAIKFTPPKGRVEIRMQRADTDIEVTVSDTGPGIDEEFLPYVFDRFRQADTTISRQFGGLGLGLSIVRQVIELHGGSVVAANRITDTGAIFTLRLPAIAGHKLAAHVPELDSRLPASTMVSPPAESTLALEGLKVLAVDDEPDARLLLATILGQYGAIVRTCGSSAEALAILSEFRPDILVSDIGMPHEDGYSLIKKVRQSNAPEEGRIPAVALTAYARVEDRLQALAAGYNMHVTKPVEPAELAVIVASLTGRCLPTRN